MQLANKHIAIWGYAHVGKAVAAYAQQQNACVTIFDRTVHTYRYDAHSNLWFAPEKQLQPRIFDYIVPSPGIDINRYPELLPGCVPEYDLFYQHSTVPHIGITGSLGKTTITSLVTHALHEAGISAHLGGNIGVPMFTLLNDTLNAAYHVLELSSFQLEHIQYAAPHIAVVTNFYSNHLDRHKTTHAYLQAKCNIFRQQSEEQHALLPISLRNIYTNIHPNRSCHVFATSWQEYITHRHTLLPTDTVYYISEHAIYKYTLHTHTVIADIPQTITFAINWLVVASIFDILGYTLPTQVTPHREHSEHRREYIGTYNSVTWYNDSKATIMPATCAAIHSLQPQPIILILGGLSKGVDRSPYLASLASGVTHIICWGNEAQMLYEICHTHGIPATQCTTLREATQHANNIATPNTAVLLSPGGASFDQFSSYQERGRAFKQLVAEYADHS